MDPRKLWLLSFQSFLIASLQVVSQTLSSQLHQPPHLSVFSDCFYLVYVCATHQHVDTSYSFFQSFLIASACIPSPQHLPVPARVSNFQSFLIASPLVTILLLVLVPILIFNFQSFLIASEVVGGEDITFFKYPGGDFQSFLIASKEGLQSRSLRLRIHIQAFSLF